ncbi:hypothetical protein AGOR_G00178310 [Albula goreensis]|uniref:Sec16 Sec23-binding domain-containing protein n=1 Tax=Albula goreensis TaxID=1534307 RepID=A0A8T3D0X5_9TELE|nr:hypothetical protein AGOR_G00178310 [Albula goreensis]
MDPRGYPWPGYSPHGPQYYPPRPGYSQRPRDREGYYRTGHHGDAYYPPPDARVKQWQPSDPKSGMYVASPTPRPDYPPITGTPPSPGQATTLIGQAVDHNQDRVMTIIHTVTQRGTPERIMGTTIMAITQDTIGTQMLADGPPAWVIKSTGGQGNIQSKDTNRTGPKNQQTSNPPYEFNSNDGDRARENGQGSAEASLYGAGTLMESKTSGLSSSSYELSQYIDGAEQSDLPPPSDWSSSRTEPLAVPRVEAPLKYSLPHVRACFGPAGQLIRVNPCLASEGEPALVELHSLEIILVETQEQQELRDFPGPLAREDLHKVDAISFALQRAETCLKDTALPDNASAALLWKLLVLLCRQNGRIVGSDIAELLTRDSRAPGRCDAEVRASDGPSLIDLSEDPTPETEVLDGPDLLTGAPAQTSESTSEALQKYTQLLLAGRKKEALESAMKSELWGHALFLASKMDNRSYTTVLNRFTGSLAASDPLQTLFQLLSGRIPAVATSCSSERWGDWKPHLAVMLSNETADSAVHQKSIITMGDTLATRGMLGAAHFCYLTARSPFGVYTSKTDKLVLLGSNHSLPFLKFARNTAIQCTEVFEYSQRLGNPAFFIPSFQVYKFLYACRLLDCGLASQAFHYCEVIGKALLGQEVPCAVLLGEVIKLAERLKHAEPQLSDAGADRPTRDPDWLSQLRSRQRGAQMDSYGYCDTHLAAVEEKTYTSEENGVYTDPHTDDLEYSVDGVIDRVQQADTLYPQFEGATEQHVPHVWPQQPVWEAQSQPVAPPVVGGQHCNLQFANSTYPQPSYPNMALPDQISTGQVHTGEEIQSVSAEDAQMSGAWPNAGEQGGASQMTDTQERKAREQDAAQPEKSTNSGWFSRWFKSKPNDVQKESKEDSNTTPALTEPSLPPPSSVPPTFGVTSGMCSGPPTSVGINPFSKRAGRQPSSVQGQVLSPGSTTMALS